MISPDGRFLFFYRRVGAWDEVTEGNVFRIDAEVIHRLRPHAGDAQ